LGGPGGTSRWPKSIFVKYKTEACVSSPLKGKEAKEPDSQ
jgi:hypothetical protein